MILQLILYLTILFVNSEEISTASKWLEQIKDPLYKCPTTQNSSISTSVRIFEVVDCDNPDAIFAYGFKVNQPFKIAL